MLRWFSKNSWNRPPQLLWVWWIGSHHILPVFVFFGFVCRMLVSKCSNPSKPVKRIFSSTITTLQQSSTALDRPTIGVKPGCRWAVSWSDVVQRSQPIKCLDDAWAMNIEKLRRWQTPVVFLVSTERPRGENIVECDPIQSFPSTNAPGRVHRTGWARIRDGTRDQAMVGDGRRIDAKIPDVAVRTRDDDI